MLSFRNPVVLITGTLRGVGATTAIKFAEAGVAGVVINYRANRDAALTFTEAVERTGANALLVQADVSLAEQAHALVKQTVDCFGRPDVVIANAGECLADDRTITELDDTQWMAVGLVCSEAVWECLTRR